MTLADKDRVEAVKRVIMILREGAPDRSKESNGAMAAVLLADIFQEFSDDSA